MKVLICGAGIAGPTLAYWLDHYGFEATIVEKAPALRTGGYIIDFWGTGFEVASRMALLDKSDAGDISSTESASSIGQESNWLGFRQRRLPAPPGAVTSVSRAANWQPQFLSGSKVE
jgi:2-polyprenyl-6-methoxyphenol hydroxylase-like FAD-dependent oxidoreductase